MKFGIEGTWRTWGMPIHGPVGANVRPIITSSESRSAARRNPSIRYERPLRWLSSPRNATRNTRSSSRSGGVNSSEFTYQGTMNVRSGSIPACAKFSWW